MLEPDAKIQVFPDRFLDYWGELVKSILFKPKPSEDASRPQNHSSNSASENTSRPQNFSSNSPTPTRLVTATAGIVAPETAHRATGQGPE